MADIQFENIDPYVDGQGDTGLSSRLKLKRNFDKIKAWMDSVASILSGQYLSKVNDDEAEGVITFKNSTLFGDGGVWGWVKETVADRVGTGWAWFKHLLADTLEALSALINGNLTVHGGDLTVESDELGNGGDVYVEGDLTVEGLTTLFQTLIQNLTVNHNLTVNETATITNLIVTGAAHFFKVIIDEIKAAGGAWVITPADGFTVDLVENITINGIPGKRLYWRMTDGEKARTNQWHVLDQALCKTDNLADGTTYNASNKHYWSVVANVSSQPVTKTIDGQDADCHYIDIYCGNGESQGNIPTDANDVPLWHWVGDPRTAAAGDEITMLGSRDASDVARQSALYFSAYSSLDNGLRAPFIASYRGVNDFDLASHRKTYMDAVGQAFYGQFFSQASDSDNPTDIEDLLTGSELKIIYGEGSPLVTQPEQHWTQADLQGYIDKCFYYDISQEPALEGGRFWKWTLIVPDGDTPGTVPQPGWVHVTDKDTLAALEKIADVASDGVLTGGGEKTRVYLEWIEAVKTYISIFGQVQENNASGDWTNQRSTAEYKTGVTFYTAWNNFNTAFFALATYLNNKTDFSSSYENTLPAWINDQNRGTSTVLPAWTNTETPPGKAEWNTGAKAYRGVWADFYETMVEMTRALNAWQYKVIDEMGDDGLIDAAEKAMLRQVMNDEVIAYWKRAMQCFDLMDKIPTTESVYTALTQAETAMQNTLNQLGSYLCGATPAEKTGGGWYIAAPLPWSIQNSMKNGLQDPPSSGTAPSNLYPVWLRKANQTQSEVVDDDIWDYFWAEFTKAKQNHIDAIAAANQYQIDRATEGILPQVFIQATAPTDFKEGDHWYQPTTLTNPVTGQEVSQDQQGNPIYNHYIARRVNGTLQWVLVNAATTSVFSQIASQIYSAVFDSTNASSIVQKANSIEGTVSKMIDGGKNLLLNGDFSDGTRHFATYNNAAIAVVQNQGAANFENVLQITSSSSGSRGIQFSLDEQPYITLQSGKTYCLSLYAMAAGSKNLYVQREGSLSGARSIGTSWARYSWTFSGDDEGKTFVISDAANNASTFYITGLQLEEGNTPSSWERGTGNMFKIQSLIQQVYNKISLAVYKEEARKAGIDIEYDEETDSGTVTLDGDKVIVDGDLDIKGLVTNSAQFIDYSDNYSKDSETGEETGFVHETLDLGVFGEEYYKMIVPVDLKKVKSVVLRGISKDNSISGDDTLTITDPLVILPAYTRQTINGVATIPACQQSGIQLTIANAFQRRYAKWRQSGHLTLQQLWACATIIVSDPRVLNYSSAVSIATTTSTAEAHANSFIVNGQLGKVLVLMPGQMVKLTSVIHKYGTSTVLRWYVENASDFVPVTGEVDIWRALTGQKGTVTAYRFQAQDYYDNLALFAPSILTQSLGTNLCFNILTMNGEWPCIDKNTGIFDSVNTNS